MEYFYGILFFLVLVGIIIGGSVLGRIARQKAADLGAGRLASRQQLGREQSKPGHISLNDTVTVGLPYQTVQEALTKTKLLKLQEDGSWTQQSAFSKDYPFTVQLRDLGAETQLFVSQHLSKQGVLDGDIYWAATTSAVHKLAQKTGAHFAYQPYNGMQTETLDKGVLRHFHLA
ncbi:MAG: hypothetical protein WBA28_01585 [Microbacteriaceae bacterium]